MKKKRKIPSYAVVTIIAVICFLINIIKSIFPYIPKFWIEEYREAWKMLSYIEDNIELSDFEENDAKVSLCFDEDYHTIIYDITSEYYLFNVKRLVEKYLENNPQVEFNDYKVKISSIRDLPPYLPQEYWWILESTNYEVKFDKLLCSHINENTFHDPNFDSIVYLNIKYQGDVDFNRFTNLKVASLYSGDVSGEDTWLPLCVSHEFLEKLKKKLPQNCQIVGYVIDDDEGITQW